MGGEERGGAELRARGCSWQWSPKASHGQQVRGSASQELLGDVLGTRYTGVLLEGGGEGASSRNS